MLRRESLKIRLEHAVARRVINNNRTTITFGYLFCFCYSIGWPPEIITCHVVLRLPILGIVHLSNLVSFTQQSNFVAFISETKEKQVWKFV
jgi:hypothetical protein